MKCGVDVDGAQRMNPTTFGHAPNFQILLALTELVLPQLLEPLP